MVHPLKGFHEHVLFQSYKSNGLLRSTLTTPSLQLLFPIVLRLYVMLGSTTRMKSLKKNFWSSMSNTVPIVPLMSNSCLMKTRVKARVKELLHLAYQMVRSHLPLQVYSKKEYVINLPGLHNAKWWKEYALGLAVPGIITQKSQSQKVNGDCDVFGQTGISPCTTNCHKVNIQ